MPLRHLLLVFTLLLGPLYGQSVPFKAYIETGLHSEELSWKLERKKKSLRESFSSVKWNQIYVPEIRFGVLYRFHPCLSLALDSGCLLSSPSFSQFHASYCEKYGCRPFKNHPNSKNHISGNEFSIGMGYVEEPCSFIQLTTTLGYAEQRRLFTANPHNFTTKIDHENNPHRIQISHLRYSAHWIGPWLGLKMDYAYNHNLHFIADAQYHYTSLRATGNWKAHETLSDHFIFENESKITQKGIASKVKVNANIIQNLNSQWKIGLHGYFEMLIKIHGDDSTKTQQHVSSPTAKTISQEKFTTHPCYQIRWQAWAILGGIDYVF